jgi:DnaD/phage-associated family protein
MDYQIDFGIWGSIFPVPCAVADRHLKFCSGNQLKVLLLALREAKNPVDLDAIARRLGLTPEETADCLEYWRAAGLFATAAAPSIAPVPTSTPEKDPVPVPDGTPVPASGKNAAPSLPLREEQVVAGQRITTIHSRAKLTPSQQNKLIREDKEIPQLLELLQGVLSRPLTPYETEGFLYLYSGLRLSAGYILMAAQYSRDIGRDNIRQIEKLVTGWVERGIDTYDKAEEEIARLSRCRSNEGRVKTMFGIRDRELSSREKQFIDHWYTDLGFDDELVKLAYDRTVDNTGKAAFPYLNKILTRWHETGIHTPQEAMAEMENGPRKTTAPDQEAGESSYDLEEIRRLMALGSS